MCVGKIFYRSLAFANKYYGDDDSFISTSQTLLAIYYSCYDVLHKALG